MLNMLDLAGIPLYAKDRKGLGRIVVAGGPCACNCEPLADFLDLVFLGEGEEVDREVIELYRDCKKTGKTREEFLAAAAGIEGVYAVSYTHLDVYKRQILDSYFVAQISESALTAVSLAFPIQTLMIAVGVGTGVGINSLVARRLGEKRQADADCAASHGLLLGVFNWILFALFGIFFTKMFFGAFTDIEEIITMGTQYTSCLLYTSGQGKPEAEAIVRTDASALVEDVKVVADKLIVKGEALIKVLYMGSIENGTLETMEFSIPVSQIVDAPGTDEGCLCDARLSVMGCSLQIRTDSDGADTLLSCEMKLMATAVSYREMCIRDRPGGLPFLPRRVGHGAPPQPCGGKGPEPQGRIF